MYKNFKLTDEEKKEIFEMHKEGGYKQPLNESVVKAEATEEKAEELNEAKEILKTIFNKLK